MAASRPNNNDSAEERVEFLYNVIKGVKDNYKDGSYKKAAREFEEIAKGIKDNTSIPAREKAEKLFNLIHDTFNLKQAADRHLTEDQKNVDPETEAKAAKRSGLFGMFKRSSTKKDKPDDYQKSLNTHSGDHHYSRMLSAAFNIAATRCPDLVGVEHAQMKELAEGIHINPSYRVQQAQLIEAKKAANPEFRKFYETLAKAGVSDIDIVSLSESKKALDAVTFSHLFPKAHDYAYVTGVGDKLGFLKGDENASKSAIDNLTPTQINSAVNVRVHREHQEMVDAALGKVVPPKENTDYRSITDESEKTMLKDVLVAVNAIKERVAVNQNVAASKNEESQKQTHNDNSPSRSLHH